jgi:RNA polymerase primary sigma factor
MESRVSAFKGSRGFVAAGAASGRKNLTADPKDAIMYTSPPRKNGPVRDLLRQGKRQGFLSYRDLNDRLPDSFLSPGEINDILGLLEESGIRLVESPERDRRDRRAAFDNSIFGHPSSAGVPGLNQDPLRIYLAQMGEIPMVSREEEIALAERIEAARERLRRLVFESPAGAAEAARILDESGRWKSSLARNLRDGDDDSSVPGGGERLARTIEKLRRLRDDAAALRRLLERRDLPRGKRERIRRRLERNRRRCAALLESTNLRTERVALAAERLGDLLRKRPGNWPPRASGRTAPGRRNWRRSSPGSTRGSPRAPRRSDPA